MGTHDRVLTNLGTKVLCIVLMAILLHISSAWLIDEAAIAQQIPRRSDYLQNIGPPAPRVQPPLRPPSPPIVVPPDEDDLQPAPAPVSPMTSLSRKRQPTIQELETTINNLSRQIEEAKYQLQLLRNQKR